MTLLQRVETYLETTGVAATRFGRVAARDPRLVLDMRCGRMPRLRLRHRIEALIEGSQ